MRSWGGREVNHISKSIMPVIAHEKMFYMDSKCLRKKVKFVNKELKGLSVKMGYCK